MDKNEQKDKVVINFNGPITNNGGTITGDIVNPTYNFGNKNTSAMLRVKAALVKLFDEGLMSDKTQWYAIYRCLKDKYLAPSKPEDFENYINSLGIEFTIPCDKDKYKNVGSSCTRLKVDVGAWSTLTAPTTAESNQITVAKRLLELLEA